MSQPIAIKPLSSKYGMPKPQGAKEKTKGAKFTMEEIRMIQVMMQEAKELLPWKTDSDFIRWAVLKGLSEIMQDIKSKRFTNLYKQFEAATELLRREQDARRTLHLQEELRQSVAENERMGAHSEVPRLLRDFQKIIAEMEPGYWPNRLRKEFEQEWSRRLREDRISPRPRDAQKDEGEDDE